MTTYRDVHNDEYYEEPEEPESTEDRLTEEERRREGRIDDEMMEE